MKPKAILFIAYATVLSICGAFPLFASASSALQTTSAFEWVTDNRSRLRSRRSISVQPDPSEHASNSLRNDRHGSAGSAAALSGDMG